MLHAEEERFLSDDKSSEIRASTDTLPEQASDAKNVIEGQTTRNEGRLNNTIELVDSDSDGEDVAATTATVAKEKSPVAHANSVMTTTIANSGDGGLAAVDVDDVPNLADRRLSTCKPAEITLIDSDDDENGDEISKATLTAFEKTVRASPSSSNTLDARQQQKRNSLLDSLLLFHCCHIVNDYICSYVSYDASTVLRY